MSELTRHSVGSRDEVVWQRLRLALDERSKAAELAGRPRLSVLDLGGGTGIFAVPIAELGHHVTVVDTSPDSLAALERRAAEAGVTDRISSVQGDVDNLPGVVPVHSVDVVLCHNVLEFVEDPAAALAAAVPALRPGGVLSLLAANRHAVVLAKALAGHIGEACLALHDQHGRFGPADPVPRRFDVTELRELVTGTGLKPVTEHGVRIFADLLPAGASDQPEERDALADLERAAAGHPAYQGIATQLHLVARH